MTHNRLLKMSAALLVTASLLLSAASAQAQVRFVSFGGFHGRPAWSSWPSYSYSWPSYYYTGPSYSYGYPNFAGYYSGYYSGGVMPAAYAYGDSPMLYSFYTAPYYGGGVAPVSYTGVMPAGYGYYGSGYGMGYGGIFPAAYGAWTQIGRAHV